MDGFLKMPYSENFSTPLEANREIGIEAVFTKDGKKFTVMLLCDEDHNKADALLMLNVHHDDYIKVSYRKDGELKCKDKVITFYSQLKQVNLIIKLETDYFEIILNGIFKTIFKYQFPLKTVNHIWIGGDIRLTNVTLPRHYVDDIDDDDEEEEEEEKEEEEL